MCVCVALLQAIFFRFVLETREFSNRLYEEMSVFPAFGRNLTGQFEQFSFRFYGKNTVGSPCTHCARSFYGVIAGSRDSSENATGETVYSLTQTVNCKYLRQKSKK